MCEESDQQNSEVPEDADEIKFAEDFVNYTLTLLDSSTLPSRLEDYRARADRAFGENMESFIKLLHRRQYDALRYDIEEIYVYKDENLDEEHFMDNLARLRNLHFFEQLNERKFLILCYMIAIMGVKFQKFYFLEAPNYATKSILKLLKEFGFELCNLNNTAKNLAQEYEDSDSDFTDPDTTSSSSFGSSLQSSGSSGSTSSSSLSSSSSESKTPLNVDVSKSKNPKSRYVRNLNRSESKTSLNMDRSIIPYSSAEENYEKDSGNENERLDFPETKNNREVPIGTSSSDENKSNSPDPKNKQVRKPNRTRNRCDIQKKCDDSTPESESPTSDDRNSNTSDSPSSDEFTLHDVKQTEEDSATIDSLLNNTDLPKEDLIAAPGLHFSNLQQSGKGTTSPSLSARGINFSDSTQQPRTSTHLIDSKTNADIALENNYSDLDEHEKTVTAADRLDSPNQQQSRKRTISSSSSASEFYMSDSAQKPRTPQLQIDSAANANIITPVLEEESEISKMSEIRKPASKMRKISPEN